ncbi:MAG: hypothetical protein Q8K31_05460 [Burkholderiaceae bacterium]|nr:hypothetical protein [Burkholderiaceae bacterium]MDO9089981.1 hypothetical protein [Burkholderiaceae bacterium]MDP1968616.1 hypothetical protein [Burkholderiaceae bacterium]
MTSFVHIEYPTQHPGVVRAENVAKAFTKMVRGFDSARGAAALMLAALVSALLVVANQVVDTWTDGHLLAAWMVLWIVAFAALALLAKPIRMLALSMRDSMAAWSASHKQKVEDDKLLELAHRDARVMADIGRAMTVGGRRSVIGMY